FTSTPWHVGPLDWSPTLETQLGRLRPHSLGVDGGVGAKEVDPAELGRFVLVRLAVAARAYLGRRAGDLLGQGAVRGERVSARVEEHELAVQVRLVPVRAVGVERSDSDYLEALLVDHPLPGAHDRRRARDARLH